MKRIGVFVLSIDGIICLQTGVGTVVSQYIRAFPVVRQELLKRFGGVEFVLNAIAAEIDTSTSAYDLQLFKRSKANCACAGGELILVKSVCQSGLFKDLWFGGDSYRPEVQWNYVSKQAANVINMRAREYDCIVVIAHDTIFSPVAKYLEIHNSLSIIWVPHALSVNEASDGNPSKFKIELENINHLLLRGDKIGYIGDHFRDTLLAEYGVSDRSLLEMKNGLLVDYTLNNKTSHDDCYFHDRFRIPHNKDLIFSWGRCDPLKGTLDLLNGWYYFINSSEYCGKLHLILLAPDTTGNPQYAEKVFNLANECGDSVTHILEFDRELPKYVLGKKSLKAIFFCSYMEGLPMTAFEALAYSHENVKIFYNNIDGLKEVLQGRVNTMSVDTTRPDAINKVLTKNLSETIPGTTREFTNLVDYYLGFHSVIVGEFLQ